MFIFEGEYTFGLFAWGQSLGQLSVEPAYDYTDGTVKLSYVNGSKCKDDSATGRPIYYSSIIRFTCDLDQHQVSYQVCTGDVENCAQCVPLALLGKLRWVWFYNSLMVSHSGQENGQEEHRAHARQNGPDKQLLSPLFSL